MSVFKEYSNYYDLIYKDKKYPEEAAYINKLIKKYNPDSKSILDLGCGTGTHANLLAEFGYDITGVDNSEEMLQAASNQIKGNLKNNIKFMKGDIREIRLTKKFDNIVSLFHVFSYFVTNEDVKKAFATVKEHIKDDGFFIFDCWYGPAVLYDLPKVRVKKMEDDNIKVVRIVEPEINANRNYVDVNYQIFIIDKKTNDFKELKETHRMRFFFTPEIEEYLNSYGLKLIDSKEFLTEKEPGFDTWGVYFIAKKI
jgi:SAM-dependent methyltransferase